MLTRFAARNAHRVEVSSVNELTNLEHEYLQQYLQRIGTKERMTFDAQGLPRGLENAYQIQDDNFLESCERVDVSKLPGDSNVTGSHGLYKIKVLEDGSLYCKARIASYGNHDMEKSCLRADSVLCFLIGARILLSVCALMQRQLAMIDVKGPFLQSRAAECAGSVRPSKECRLKSVYCSLVVDAFGLVNANAIWRLHSDNTWIQFGLTQSP